MTRFLTAIAACLIFTACATPEQLAAQRELQRQQDMDTCASYGFRPNSDGFRNCLLQLDIAREQRDYYDTRYGGYYDYYPHRHTSGSIGYYLHR